MSNAGDIATRKSQLRMLVFLIISLFAAFLIIWQWVATVRELDKLSANGTGRFRTLIPKGAEDDATSTNSAQLKTKQVQQ